LTVTKKCTRDQEKDIGENLAIVEIINTSDRIKGISSTNLAQLQNFLRQYEIEETLKNQYFLFPHSPSNNLNFVNPHLITKPILSFCN